MKFLLHAILTIRQGKKFISPLLSPGSGGPADWEKKAGSPEHSGKGGLTASGQWQIHPRNCRSPVHQHPYRTPAPGKHHEEIEPQGDS